jgi:hypothetical protein
MKMGFEPHNEHKQVVGLTKMILDWGLTFILEQQAA